MIRTKIRVFAQLMRAEIDANDHKGLAWLRYTPEHSFAELLLHAEKLRTALAARDRDRIVEHALDCACYAFFILCAVRDMTDPETHHYASSIYGRDTGY